MKKEYIKPTIIISRFELIEQIAGGNGNKETLDTCGFVNKKAEPECMFRS